jgi:hypothetical protein
MRFPVTTISCGHLALVPNQRSPTTSWPIL